MAITHAYVSAIADSGDATIVQPTDWNADHTIAAGSITVAMLANGTDGELITWDASGVAATVAVGTATHVLTSNGVGVAPTFQAIPAASVSLDGITAAAADQAGIANADWNIRWNWAKVTNSEVAFELGESAAATGGTSTSDIPNQVLAKFSTLAASTMSPLLVAVRGTPLMWASPTTAQIFLAAGTLAAPSLTFEGQSGIGLRQGADSTGNPALIIQRDANTATFFRSLGIYSYAAIGPLDIRGYRSSGTLASPTAITTGDDLFTLRALGYVGATNTYQEAARITFDSTGTISDSATGIGGIFRIQVAKVGAEVAEIMRFTAGTTTGGGWATMNEADASPGTADLADWDEAAVYVKAGNIVFAQNVAGTINFLYAPLDGTTTLWTANTTGP